MSLVTTISGGISGKEVSALDAGSATFPFAFSTSYALTSGTAAGMADKVWSDTRTLAASGTEDLDLAAGGLLDAIGGAALTFVKIKGIYVKAAAANTNNVVVGATAANGFVGWFAAADTNSIALKPGYFFLLGGSGAGYTVTATTGDKLTITNSGGTTGVTYDIAIIGCSA